MDFIDIWSILTGFASLIALFLYLNEKYSDWQRYTIPASWAFGGFAVGRITGSATPAVVQPFLDIHLIGVILISLIFLGTSLFIWIFLSKQGETRLAYIVFIAILTIGAPNTIHAYLSSNPDVSTGDYLKLALMKERDGETEEAIRYLEIFSQKTSDSVSRKQIENKIKDIRAQQLNQPKELSNLK